MAGRSEQIDALLLSMEDLVAAEYAAASLAKFEETEGKPTDDRLAATTLIAKAGFAVKQFRSAGKRVAKAFAALRVASASDAEETPMNDDARWTPERIDALHAKVRERLAKFAGSRELKHLAERELAKPDRAMAADPAVQGKSSAPAG